ncbi:hypothetical protein FACS189452_07290 [Bacteroidia bacterium]|nr:hypothetical protein FACS189452_07290 [Bacteroidia bacterium]
MKKLLFVAAAVAVLAGSACTNEEMRLDTPGAYVKGEVVDITVTAGIPQNLVAYATAGKPSLAKASKDGGATNLDSDGSPLKLRYLVEVWTVGAAEPFVRDTFVAASPKGNATFTLRLPTDDYNFVFWADFVTDENGADNHYNTTAGLKAITWNHAAHSVSDESRDAYTLSQQLRVARGAALPQFELVRPFGKIRLVSIDTVGNAKLLADSPSANLGIAPKKVILKTGEIRQELGFNALAGTSILAGGKTTVVFEQDDNILAPIVAEDVVTPVKTYEGALILAFDYLLPPDNGLVSFDVEVYDDKGLIGTRHLTDIPVVANQLTTVVGNFSQAFDATLGIFVGDGLEGPTYEASSIHIGSKTYSTLADAIAGAEAGDIIVLGGGEYSVGAGIEIAKNITIRGLGLGGAKIEAVSPTDRSTAGTQGKNPIFFVTEGDVTFDNVAFSTAQTPTNIPVDGITITGGTLTLNNVVFDGITNVGGLTGNQYGRAVTAYGSSEVTVKNSVFKNINKNAIHLLGSAQVKVDNSTFIGSASNPLIAQNGVVFIGTSTGGTITNSTFKDFTNTHLSGAESCAVLIYDNTDAAMRVIDDGGNIYSHNQLNWYVNGTGEAVETTEPIAASTIDLWTKDRYVPSDWAVVDYQGRTAIKSTVDIRTATANRTPDGNKVNDKNIQGRLVPTTNTNASKDWEVEAEIYVSSAMLTEKKPYAVSVWAFSNVTTPDAAKGEWYGIIAVTNVTTPSSSAVYDLDALNPRWVIWQLDKSGDDYSTASASNNGWVETSTLLPALTAGWHKIKIVAAGNNQVEYFINGVSVGVLCETPDGHDFAVTKVALQNYNFTTITGGKSFADYSFDAYFANVKVTANQ